VQEKEFLSKEKGLSF